MRRKSFVAAAAVAFIVSAGCHDLRAEPVAPAAADQTLGMALMYAAVAANGTLTSGSGVVSSTPGGQSTYLVIFERSILNCGYAVTLAQQTGIFPTAGSAAASTAVYNPVLLNVLTRDQAGAAADRPFHVMVFCPK